MDDGLIERLRSTGTSLFRPEHPASLLMWEAAEAIERLRSDHKVLREALEPLLRMIDKPIVGSGADWRKKLDEHAANIRAALTTVPLGERESDLYRACYFADCVRRLVGS